MTKRTTNPVEKVLKAMTDEKNWAKIEARYAAMLAKEAAMKAREAAMMDEDDEVTGGDAMSAMEASNYNQEAPE